jgi:hypothetical protein
MPSIRQFPQWLNNIRLTFPFQPSFSAFLIFMRISPSSPNVSGAGTGAPTLDFWTLDSRMLLA